MQHHMPAAAVEAVDIGCNHRRLWSAVDGDIFIHHVNRKTVVLEASCVGQAEGELPAAGQDAAPASVVLDDQGHPGHLLAVGRLPVAGRLAGAAGDDVRAFDLPDERAALVWMAERAGDLLHVTTKYG